MSKKRKKQSNKSYKKNTSKKGNKKYNYNKSNLKKKEKNYWGVPTTSKSVKFIS